MITLINSGYAQVVHPFRAENVYNTLKEGVATPTELSDIEKFNAALIKQVMAGE